MTRAEAVSAVNAEVESRLNVPVKLVAGGHTWSVTPAELGEAADVGAAVDDALRRSASVGFLSRVWHRMRHEPVDISVELDYATGGTAVSDLVSSISGEVARDPRDASIAVVDGEVTFVHSAPGRALGANVARKRIFAALADGTTKVVLPEKKVRPDVPDAKLGKTIVVDRATNVLSFYNRFELVHRYNVATAADGYVTPAGDWSIVDKQENPTWYNPAPDTWGADLPASIPPGPGNPLGTRALYLNAPGIRIHGTYDTSSIGTHASHGCIRMLIPDVEQLYPLVPIGTRVIVF
jgi:lipoprotein-anchoring transpeptidase ErfK/SrfK